MGHGGQLTKNTNMWLRSRDMHRFFNKLNYSCIKKSVVQKRKRPMDEQNESFKEMQKISFLKTNEKNELLKIV